MAGTAQKAGTAAGAAEELKVAKYVGHLAPEYEFLPLGFETLGSMGPSSTDFLRDLGHRLIAATGDKRSLEYLYQRLSLATRHPFCDHLWRRTTRWALILVACLLEWSLVSFGVDANLVILLYYL